MLFALCDAAAATLIALSIWSPTFAGSHWQTSDKQRYTGACCWIRNPRWALAAALNSVIEKSHSSSYLLTIIYSWYTYLASTGSGIHIWPKRRLQIISIRSTDHPKEYTITHFTDGAMLDYFMDYFTSTFSSSPLRPDLDIYFRHQKTAKTKQPKYFEPTQPNEYCFINSMWIVMFILYNPQTTNGQATIYISDNWLPGSRNVRSTGGDDSSAAHRWKALDLYFPALLHCGLDFELVLSSSWNQSDLRV